MFGVPKCKRYIAMTALFMSKSKVSDLAVAPSALHYFSKILLGNLNFLAKTKQKNTVEIAQTVAAQPRQLHYTPPIYQKKFFLPKPKNLVIHCKCPPTTFCNWRFKSFFFFLLISWDFEKVHLFYPHPSVRVFFSPPFFGKGK